MDDKKRYTNEYITKRIKERTAWVQGEPYGCGATQRDLDIMKQQQEDVARLSELLEALLMDTWGLANRELAITVLKEVRGGSICAIR